MILIDGKKLSAEIKQELTTEVAQIKAEGGKVPHLAAVLVGNSAASEFYVASKVKSCEQVGFKSTLIKREDDISENDLLQLINDLNNDPDIDGFIVQLPLPKHINEERITLAIAPEKDVDGFHPINLGRMVLGMDTYLPATPMGILEMLKRYDIPTSGKNCVVLGRSNIVGTPMSILLSRKGWDCTVTLAHSRTQNLKELCLNADILVAAIGIAEFVTPDMIKAGAVVIDVGINRIDDPSHPKGYRVVGDVEFKGAAEKASHITPVPGGVGLMTVASLLLNTLKAAKNKK